MDQRSGNNTYGYGGNGGRGGGRGRGGEGGRGRGRGGDGGRGRGGYGGGRGRGRDGSSYQQSQSQGSGGNYQQPSGGYGGKGGGRSQFASDRRPVRPLGNQPVQSAPVQAWGNRSVQGWSVGPMGGRGAWKGGQTKEAEAETVIVSADFMGPKLQGSINLQITSFAAVLLGGFATVLSILVRGFNIYKNKSPDKDF